MRPRRDLLRGGVSLWIILREERPLHAASQVLAWLNQASSSPFSGAEIAAEIERIERRPRGDAVWTQAKEMGFHTQHFGTNLVYARCLGLRPLEVGGVTLCVDVFNLDGELEWDSDPSVSVVELLVTQGRPSEGLFQTALAITSNLEAVFCLGGAGSFMAGFFNATARHTAPVVLSEYLWPITVLRHPGPVSAPAFKSKRSGHYLGIQVEDELFAGHPDVYAPICRELSLRTLWHQG